MSVLSLEASHNIIQVQIFHTECYRTHWQLGGVPDDWKRANVSHLFRQERGPRELLAGQPHHNPWDSDGANNPIAHFQT